MTKELKPQPPCPECEKLAKVSEESNKIGDFLDWLQHEQGILFCRWEDPGKGYTEESLNVVGKSINGWLADYYEIDLNKVEQERRALLDWIREVQS